MIGKTLTAATLNEPDQLPVGDARSITPSTEGRGPLPRWRITRPAASIRQRGPASGAPGSRIARLQHVRSVVLPRRSGEGLDGTSFHFLARSALRVRSCTSSGTGSRVRSAGPSRRAPWHARTRSAAALCDRKAYAAWRPYTSLRRHRSTAFPGSSLKLQLGRVVGRVGLGPTAGGFMRSLASCSGPTACMNATDLRGYDTHFT